MCLWIHSHSTQEDVGNVGIDIFKVLYGSKGKFYHISSRKEFTTQDENLKMIYVSLSLKI